MGGACVGIGPYDIMRQALDDWKETFELQLQQSRARIAELMETADFIDADGYPTETALEVIELWHWDDISGWFAFIKELWYMRDWGWSTAEVPHSHRSEKIMLTKEHSCSTAGWSGNESIIRAMQNNHTMWHLNWVSSRRGGHYVFQEYVLDK